MTIMSSRHFRELAFCMTLTRITCSRLRVSQRFAFTIPMTSCFMKVEPAEHVYLVVSGRIVLELCPATIYQKNLMSVGPGEMLGWSSFVEQRNYASTGVVVAPTQLVKIDGKKLRAICDRDPEFGYDFMHRIMRALAKRLTTTWSQLANIYVPNTLPMLAGVSE